MRKLLLSIALVWSSLHAFAQVQQIHLPYEIPAKLTDRPEQIIKHCGFTISYNKERGTPNWSAWMLTSVMVKNDTLARADVFLPDPCVPYSYRVTPSDYTGSGYDRGHMCPAADMAWSQESMHDCFYMSNMCPQVQALNRICWKALESACRKWVMNEDTLYIVAGPIYRSVPMEIGRSHKVDIPTGFFKVILSLRKGNAKAIGFYYQNTTQKQSISTTASTVDYIEHLTGIDFFYKLDDPLEELLESQCDIRDWK